MFANYADSRTI